MVADRNHPNTSFITSFMPYNTYYFHYRQIFSPFLKSPTRLPTCLRHLLSVTNFPQNDNILVFNCFSFRHVTDISPTFISDIYIGITATLPPHYRHYYRQTEICTDIYTDKTESILSVHRATTELLTFPKLLKKGENKKI